ncbi:MAG: DUF3393 domain-containing protein [Thermodesulfobacteria bacterium]|nr:DUF3393 domain-containing protein [Thermodesulfobacteriota bacterium]
MKTKFLVLIIMIFVFLGISHSQSFAQRDTEFQEFLKQRNQEFYQYKKRLEEEFKEYKRIVEEEFKRYKEEIKKVWGTAEITTRKKWVEYDEGYKIRKVVDFSKGEVEISVITQNPKEARKKIVNTLKNLLVEDKRTAFKRDVLAHRIESRLKKVIKNVQTGKIDRTKILTPIFFNKPPTETQIERKVKFILKVAKKEVKPAKQKGEEVFTIKFKLPPNYLLKKAKQYEPLVNKYSRKNALPPALVFAIIHTESSFNPLAKSPIPAYGLMQIVPQTAGKDATRVLYGRPMLLAPSYLYNSKNNIVIGTTYFNLLYYKYLKGIKNPLSRLYCAIAAYNTGVGNVAYALTGSYSLRKLVKKVNSMTPSQVFQALESSVPQETKNYLKRVTNRIKLYKALFGA